jgi:hypothetical protein
MSACPLCKRPIQTSLPVTSLPVVLGAYDLRGHEAAVLTAIWNGKGLPVMPMKIFDVMYEDDPNGGPSETEMYHSFKVALLRLRDRLEGSGVSIESVGYRKGYRLSLR